VNRQILDAWVGQGLTATRLRAMVVAAELLYETGHDRDGATRLVIGTKRWEWRQCEWMRLRAELARRLALGGWSDSEIAGAIRSDRRTIRRWLGSGDKETET